MFPIQRKNATLLEKLFKRSDLSLTTNWEYHKLTSGGFIPLSLDNLGKDESGAYRFAMAHNLKQNGDNMADPDMEIHYFAGDIPWVVAMHYQNDFAGVFNRRNASNGADMDSFLNTWLKNLIEQGHTLNG